MLYSLFLNDLTGVMERIIRQHRFPKRVKEIFLAFLHLLPQHFAEHHDIGFYADRLCITQISDRLHFAEATTFARFFNRMRGMNPKEFRKR
jgi:AraC-like DNA-binding protein